MVTPKFERVRVPGDRFWLDPLFILRKCRRRGIGATAASMVFTLHPGPWQVGQMPGNVAAQASWRNCIAWYTGGGYTEQTLASGWWQGVIQPFRGPGPAGVDASAGWISSGASR